MMAVEPGKETQTLGNEGRSRFTVLVSGTASAASLSPVGKGEFNAQTSKGLKCVMSSLAEERTGFVCLFRFVFLITQLLRVLKPASAPDLEHV